MTTTVKWDLFLAHAGPDKARAEQLYDALVALDPRCRVFLDSKCLMPGDEWDLELPRALAASRACVVLVSQRIEKAYYAREEIALSITLKRDPDEVHRTIPVYLDGMPSDPLGGIPYGLRHLHGIDVLTTGWPDGVARELLKAIQQLPQETAPQLAPLVFDSTDIFEQLCRMLPAQLDAVMTHSGFNRAYLTTGAPPATRASELIHLGSQSPDAGRRLVDAVRKVRV